jgi:UMP-CMP kinase
MLAYGPTPTRSYFSAGTEGKYRSTCTPPISTTHSRHNGDSRLEEPPSRLCDCVCPWSVLLDACGSNSPNHLLGAPGAGKGTLSTHLAREHSMLHYSVGDSLRGWMRSNRDTLLAAQIRDKLDNQGFLSSEDLNPILEEAIIAAFNHEEPRYEGIIIDGFPRCIEQLDSFDTWPFQDKLPLAPGSDGLVAMDSKPDVVLSFGVSKLNAKARYLGRGRDDNDSEEKFERRFEEYERETTLVEEEYRRRGILVDASSKRSRGKGYDANICRSMLMDRRLTISLR